MYIVTRTFRDANGVFKVGSVVEPTTVKAFKSRLQQRHIIDVNEQNIDKWSQYFINRHGIDLTEVLAGVAYDRPIQSDSTTQVVAEDTSDEVEEATEDVIDEPTTEESTDQPDSTEVSW